MPHEDDVTGLLVAWGQGDRAADSRLIAVVYEDLRRVARRRLRAERADHSLAPTALVHEGTCASSTYAACDGRTARTSSRLRRA